MIHFDHVLALVCYCSIRDFTGLVYDLTGLDCKFISSAVFSIILRLGEIAEQQADASEDVQS